VAPDRLPAFAIWITGLPASGKSVITAALVGQLQRRGIQPAVLESDVLRKSFSEQPRYDEQDREYFYASMAFIGQTLIEHGITVIFDATANKRFYRDRARRRIAQFLEVYVDTPLEVCMQRDPKGIYRRAETGQAQHVPGLQSEYEPPTNPDIVIHGETEKPEDAAARIISLLESRLLVGPTRM
jgi:adenylylsulfate kinase